jgi:hypothetical protein
MNPEIITKLVELQMQQFNNTRDTKTKINVALWTFLAVTAGFAASHSFGFRPSEQRLLLTALEGGTDEQNAEKLGISVSAVKKSLRLVYERVAACDANLIPDQRWQEQREDNLERGKTKKQQLLAHLREHMEELRPLPCRA